MNEIPERTRLLRNLRDAGCDKAIIQKYFQLKEEGRSSIVYYPCTGHHYWINYMLVSK